MKVITDDDCQSKNDLSTAFLGNSPWSIHAMNFMVTMIIENGKFKKVLIVNRSNRENLEIRKNELNCDLVTLVKLRLGNHCNDQELYYPLDSVRDKIGNLKERPFE